METVTQEKMNELLQFQCVIKDGDCDSCCISKQCEACYGNFGEERFYDLCEEAYDVLMTDLTTAKNDDVAVEVEVPEVTHDSVNHPKHYCREGAMECIDEMVLIFGKEAVKNFCLLNSWKYRYRAADKNGEEDMKKSDFYIRKFKELNDGCI